MKTLSLSEAKMKLNSLVESVHSTDEEIVITKNGSPAAVLISPDEFEGWKETVAIRADAEPAAGLGDVAERCAELQNVELATNDILSLSHGLPPKVKIV